MTKARDLASGAPAPAGVTTTELGFVDGVTSAIQTQLGTKIAQATAINPAIVDAKGDLITATANDTPARLAVGANGTVLQANSATATGLEWAAPAVGDITAVTAGTGMSGGGTSGDVTVTNSMATAIDAKGDLVAGTGADAFSRLAVGANGTFLKANNATATGLEWGAVSAAGTNYSLISSTNLSGAQTITISGISGKNKLMVIIQSARDGAGTDFTFRLNADAGTNYNTFGWSYDTQSTYGVNNLKVIQSLTQTQFRVGSCPVTNADTTGIFMIDGANTANRKSVNFCGGSGGGAGALQYVYNGFYDGGSAISSVSLISSISNFTSGTLLVYGSDN